MNERERKAILDCQRGGIQGLRVLYDLYKDRVFRTCFRILGERSAAEDATQEIFVRVFQHIARYDRRSSFSTWLYRVAVNHALNLLQQKRREGTADAESTVDMERLVAPSPGPEQGLLEAEVSSHLQNLLASLSPEHRAILVLREVEGLSYREITEVLGIPVGTVMSRLSRAREALRSRWRETNRAGIDPRSGLSKKGGDFRG